MMMSDKNNLKRGAMILAASAAVLAGSTLPAFASTPVLTKNHEEKRPITVEQCYQYGGQPGFNQNDDKLVCRGGSAPDHPIKAV
jgi:hypothetical protein